MHSNLSIFAVVFAALAAFSCSPSSLASAAVMPSPYLGQFGYEFAAMPKRSLKNRLGKNSHYTRLQVIFPCPTTGQGGKSPINNAVRCVAHVCLNLYSTTSNPAIKSIYLRIRISSLYFFSAESQVQIVVL